MQQIEEIRQNRQREIRLKEGSESRSIDHHESIVRSRQYLATFVVCSGGFSLGVCLGWNSSAYESLINYVNADTLELGLVGGIFNVGICMGISLLPIIMKSFSKIGSMMMTVPIIFLGWSCITFAGQTVPLLLLGRTLCGFSGTFCVLAPNYIAEISDEKIRGRLLVSFQLFLNSGIMFAYVFAHVTIDEETIWVYSLICAVTTAPVALVILLPESPIYHLKKGNEEQAKISLKYFRGNEYMGFDREFNELRGFVDAQESKRVTLKMLREKPVIRSLATSCGVMLMNQFGCTSPFIFYIFTIFKHGGSGHFTPSVETLIVGAAQIAGTIIAMIFIDTCGRKPLLIISSVSMSVFLILMGWFSKVEQDDPKFADGISWMPLAWISLYLFSLNIGVGPIAWVYLGEIFPCSVKIEFSIASSILNWLISLTMILSFLEISEGIGKENMMWLFAGISLIGTIFTMIFIKETKQLSIVEMEEKFDSNPTSIDTTTSSHL
ncbi:facilitated trehalose transporter Tret1-like [Athalia rosae]|uniref:facilitated trehalose transporter Tret1-like n=1 Tax=Athalia rosae TaxID=37344 RepID=UPI002033AF5B|nr:facilitated trehalose transporter Tret1-like [Athalia rosae]